MRAQFPSVSRLLHKFKVNDPSIIPASGPGGRLLKGDVLQWVSSGMSGFDGSNSSVSVPSVDKHEINFSLPMSKSIEVIRLVKSGNPSRTILRENARDIIRKTLHDVMSKAGITEKINISFFEQETKENVPNDISRVVIQGFDSVFPPNKPRELDIEETESLMLYLSGKISDFKVPENVDELKVEPVEQKKHQMPFNDPVLEFLSSTNLTLYKSNINNTQNPHEPGLEIKLTLQSTIDNSKELAENLQKSSLAEIEKSFSRI